MLQLLVLQKNAEEHAKLMEGHRLKTVQKQQAPSTENNGKSTGGPRQKSGVRLAAFEAIGEEGEEHEEEEIKQDEGVIQTDAEDRKDGDVETAENGNKGEPEETVEQQEEGGES